MAKAHLPATVRTYHQAALFEAERWFPFSVEEMLVAYEITENAESVFLAVNRAPLEHILSVLSELNMHVIAIAPASLVLATPQLNQWSNGTGQVSIHLEDKREDLGFTHHRLTEWSFNSSLDSSNSLALNDDSVIPKLEILNLKKEPGEAIESFEVTLADRNSFDREVVNSLPVVLTALTRQQFAWDFCPRNNESNQAQWKRRYQAGLAITLVMIALSAIFFLRAASYDRHHQTIESELSQLSSQLFPGQRVRSIKNRLELENEELSNRLNRTEELLHSDRVMQLLAAWLTAMPDKPIVDLTLVAVQGDAVVVNGNAAKLEDVSQFIRVCKEGGMVIKEDKFGLSFVLTMTANSTTANNSQAFLPVSLICSAERSEQ
jgi:hypothetical protein